MLSKFVRIAPCIASILEEKNFLTRDLFLDLVYFKIVLLIFRCPYMCWVNCIKLDKMIHSSITGTSLYVWTKKESGNEYHIVLGRGYPYTTMEREPFKVGYTKERRKRNMHQWSALPKSSAIYYTPTFRKELSYCEC